MSNVRFPYVRAHGREEKGQNQILPHVRFHGDLGRRSRNHANCKKLKRTFSAPPVIAFSLLFAMLVIASRHRRRGNLHKDCFTYVRNDKKRHTERAKAPLFVIPSERKRVERISFQHYKINPNKGMKSLTRKIFR